MTSKYRGILDGAKNRGPGAADAPQDATPDDERPTPLVDAPPSPAPPGALPSRGPGRPRGKRSDPGFIQATAYIPAELHHAVKLALLQERRGREFSELVAELLAEWVKPRV